MICVLNCCKVIFGECLVWHIAICLATNVP